MQYPARHWSNLLRELLALSNHCPKPAVLCRYMQTKSAKDINSRLSTQLIALKRNIIQVTSPWTIIPLKLSMWKHSTPKIAVEIPMRKKVSIRINANLPRLGKDGTKITGNMWAAMNVARINNCDNFFRYL